MGEETTKRVRYSLACTKQSTKLTELIISQHCRASLSHFIDFLGPSVNINQGRQAKGR